MKDQLVTLETVLLAKEKGFDINTTSDCWVKTLDGQIIHNSERKNCVEHDRCEQWIMQPTQSSLQKWLREKHFIDVKVASNSRTCHFPMIAILDLDGTTMKGPAILVIYKTHELALEPGLQEALKLIDNITI